MNKKWIFCLFVVTHFLLIGQLVAEELPKSELAVVEGLGGKKLFNSDLILVPAVGQGSIQYELVTNADVVADINANSPVLSESGLKIASQENKQVSYLLRLKHVRLGYLASDDLVLEFVIDRQKPELPDLQGLEDINFLSQSIELEPRTSSNSSIWYRISSKDYPSQADRPDFLAIEELGIENFQLLQNRYIALPAPSKNNREYRLSAYSQNQAGNQSEIVSWTFVVESETVYVVDNTSLNDKFQNGSRKFPFNSLSSALLFAERNQKTVVKLSGGNFPLANELKIVHSVALLGSNSIETWKPDSNKLTIVYPSTSFMGQNLIVVQDSSVQFFKIYLTDSGRSIKSLFRSSRANLTFTDCNVATTKALSAIEAVQSEVSIVASLVSCNDPLVSDLIVLNESKLVLNSSIVENSDLPSLLLKQSRDAVYVLIKANKSQITSQSSKFVSRSGKNTTNIFLDKSTLEARDSSFLGGYGTELSVILDAQNQSAIGLVGCHIESSLLAKTSVNVRLFKGKFESSQSTMAIQGKLLAYGFIVNQAQIESLRSNYKLSSAQDFLCLVSSDDSLVTFTESEISGEQTGDLNLAILRNSESVWTENNILLASNLKRATAFSIQGEKQSIFENNHLVGSRDALLLVVTSKTFWLTMTNNLLEGWSYLLSQRGLPEEIRTQSLQDLEKIESGKSKFGANRVQVGL